MIWWGVTLPNAHLDAQGGVWGGCAPSEAEKFSIFEIGIMQFSEYFWVQVQSRQWIKQNLKKNKQTNKQKKTIKNKKKKTSSMDLADPFCILGEILVNILLESYKISHFSFF